MVKNNGAGAALTTKSTGAPVLFPGVPDSAAMIPSYTLPAPNLNNGSGAGTGFTAQTSLLVPVWPFSSITMEIPVPTTWAYCHPIPTEAYPSSRETVRACASKTPTPPMTSA